MFPTKILAVHNFYQQPGGEDRVFEAESELFGRRGHAVVRHEAHNASIGNSFAAGFSATWNHSSYRSLRTLAQANKPEVAHFHNTFPLISPAGYYALHAEGVPVVQKLSNFRLLCPGANLLRDGAPCESCIEQRSLLPALVHRCYRDSFAATGAVAAMLTAHRTAGTWQRMVDVYIALSEFARKKYIEGGLPAERIVVKPNFVRDDPGPGSGGGGYALYVGRLSEEKGIRLLAQAWDRLPDIPLLVAGDGPLVNTAWPAGVTWLGTQPRDQVLALMQNARVLIFPSICYECAPGTIIEAFACGLPVIASNLGSIPEFVEHRRSGLMFRSGDADDLARQVRWAFENTAELLPMRAAARREYEQKYTAERGYRMLLDVYAMARENARLWQRMAS